MSAIYRDLPVSRIGHFFLNVALLFGTGDAVRRSVWVDECITREDHAVFYRCVVVSRKETGEGSRSWLW